MFDDVIVLFGLQVAAAWQAPVAAAVLIFRQSVAAHQKKQPQEPGPHVTNLPGDASPAEGELAPRSTSPLPR